MGNVWVDRINDGRIANPGEVYGNDGRMIDEIKGNLDNNINIKEYRTINRINTTVRVRDTRLDELENGEPDFSAASNVMHKPGFSNKGEASSGALMAWRQTRAATVTNFVVLARGSVGGWGLAKSDSYLQLELCRNKTKPSNLDALEGAAAGGNDEPFKYEVLTSCTLTKANLLAVPFAFDSGAITKEIRAGDFCWIRAYAYNYATTFPYDAKMDGYLTIQLTLKEDLL